MARPTEFPVFNTNESNLEAIGASRESDGWIITGGTLPEKPPVGVMNKLFTLIYKWLVYLDGVVTGVATNLITTQAEFDALFDGTLIEDSYIFLKSTGTPYILSNIIPIGSNVIIDGDVAIVNRGSATARFTIAGGSGTEKKNIHFRDGWIFDGQGGQGSFGGSYNLTGVSGGFCNMDYVQDSSFECRVRNCRCDIGGAYKINNLLNVSIKNISYCYANTNGGGVVGETTTDCCLSCSIINVTNCVSVGHGGGVYNTYDTDIKDVAYNEVTGASSEGGGVYGAQRGRLVNIYRNDTQAGGKGGGCSACLNSLFVDIFGNSAGTGGGCYGCSGLFQKISDNEAVTDDGGGCATCVGTFQDVRFNIAAARGGGCYSCDDSVIDTVHNNTATGDGGGCHSCDDSQIKNVHNNVAFHGGGCAECSGGAISGVRDNEATYTLGGDGGGCYVCNNSKISDVKNNTARGGGGCYGCEDSSIIDVDNNDAVTHPGGGCYNCVRCSIKDVENNYTGNLGASIGGGCDSCTDCTFTGLIGNNTTASGGIGRNINNSTGLAFAIGDAFNPETIVLTRGAVQG